MQFILQEQVKELARAAEMIAEPKPKTPDELWDHVNQVAPCEKSKSDGAQQPPERAN